MSDNTKTDDPNAVGGPDDAGTGAGKTWSPATDAQRPGADADPKKPAKTTARAGGAASKPARGAAKGTATKAAAAKATATKGVAAKGVADKGVTKGVTAKATADKASAAESGTAEETAKKAPANSAEAKGGAAKKAPAKSDLAKSAEAKSAVAKKAPAKSGAAKSGAATSGVAKDGDAPLRRRKPPAEPDATVETPSEIAAPDAEPVTADAAMAEAALSEPVRSETGSAEAGSAETGPSETSDPSPTEASSSEDADVEEVPVEATPEGERIAKAIARAGLASRRDAEAMILAGRVTLNGRVLASPAMNVTDSDRITVDGEPLPARERTRLWIFHKPRGVVTTARDPEGRQTVFDALPEDLPRVVAIGRLDINTEGLLLLTNDGGLAKVIAHPDTGWLRRYRVRAWGDTDQAQLDQLRKGVTIDGMEYGPIEAHLDRVQGDNLWLTLGLREGKNREVKRILEHLGLSVNRLIRLSFGPFQLGDLEVGLVEEVRTRVLKDQLGKTLSEQAGVDFESPVREPIAPFGAPKKPEPASRAASARSEGERRPRGADARSEGRSSDRPQGGDRSYGGDRSQGGRGGAPFRPQRPATPERIPTGGLGSGPRRSVWRSDEDAEGPRPARVPRRGADPKAERAAAAERGRERVGAIQTGERRVVVERLAASPTPEPAPEPKRRPRYGAGSGEDRPRERFQEAPRERFQEAPRGEAPRGEAPRGPRPDGPRGRPDREGGERPFRAGPRPGPARSDGERPFRARDDRPGGGFGGRGAGDRSGGPRPAGKFGDRPGGDRFGSKPSGDRFGGRPGGAGGRDGDRPGGGRPGGKPFGGKPGGGKAFGAKSFGGDRPGGGRPGGGRPGGGKPGGKPGGGFGGRPGGKPGGRPPRGPR